jgi:hypothetical protein
MIKLNDTGFLALGHQEFLMMKRFLFWLWREIPVPFALRYLVFIPLAVQPKIFGGR